MPDARQARLSSGRPASLGEGAGSDDDSVHDVRSSPKADPTRCTAVHHAGGGSGAGGGWGWSPPGGCLSRWLVMPMGAQVVNRVEQGCRTTAMAKQLAKSAQHPAKTGSLRDGTIPSHRSPQGSSNDEPEVTVFLLKRKQEAIAAAKVLHGLSRNS